jgi:hypothetical protein
MSVNFQRAFQRTTPDWFFGDNTEFTIRGNFRNVSLL